MRADLPFPETLPALGVQLQLLRKGRKRLVMLPHGIVPPDALHGLHTTETHRGTFVARDPAEFIALPSAIAEDRLGELLGYGIPAKPEHTDRALTLCNDQVGEVLTVMADAETEPQVIAALQRMGGSGCQVRRTDPFAVLRARAAWWLHFFDNLSPTPPTKE